MPSEKAVIHEDVLPVLGTRTREMPSWEECRHRWQESTDDHDYHNMQVVCPKCLCPGEFYEASGEVYWPCT